jgi:hypothetical protein
MTQQQNNQNTPNQNTPNQGTPNQGTPNQNAPGYNAQDKNDKRSTSPQDQADRKVGAGDDSKRSPQDASRGNDKH